MSGALVLCFEGSVRPAQISAAVARVKSMIGVCITFFPSWPRQPTRETSELPSLTYIERKPANGRSFSATGAERFTSSTIRS